MRHPDEMSVARVRRDEWAGICTVCMRPLGKDHDLDVAGPVEAWTPERALAEMREAIAMFQREGKFSDPTFTALWLREQIAIRAARADHWLAQTQARRTA